MDRKRKKLLSQEVSGGKRTRKNDSSLTQTKGRAGRIVRIHLQNFMCHTSLEIKLDLNTNYIIGRNGSGKSAILTALIIGLGGKARTTNRGANMKSFIKVGEHTASIDITLSNTGPMAYNPSTFGSEITVCRYFSDTGSNTYKLKDENGQVITSAFREVNRLLDSLNIQIDNPVCILNQDVARTFLNSNDPAKKYIMFMKATNLESVKDEYKIALQNKKKTSNVLQLKQDEMKKLENEVKKWLQKYQAFNNVKKVENKKNNLDEEAVWAQINVIEDELKSKENKVSEADQEVQNYSDLITNKDTLKQTLTQNIEDFRHRLLEIRNEEESNQNTMNIKKAQLQKLRDTIFMKKNEISSIENLIRRKENDKQTIEEEIGRSSEYHQNKLKMIQERDRNMIETEQKQNELTKMLETADNDLGQLRSAKNLKIQEQDNLSTELQEISGKVKQYQAKIRSMKVNENNSISVYGSAIQRILDSINAHKEQFKVVPKGPVGSYIKLKDKQWALAVEEIIGTGLLMSFCVDNQNDFNVLSKIFTEVCGNSARPTIISSKFIYKIHNYSKFKVQAPQGCAALIDTLLINDPVIMNCLIDQLGIENILLIVDNNLAMNLMSNATKVPRHCTKSITLTGDQFYPDPNYRSYACRNRNARYLQVSALEAIKMYEEELKSSLENESSIRKQLNAVTNDVSRLTSEIRGLEKKCASLETARIRVERDINDLRLIELPSEPNLQILTEEMEEISKTIESKQRDLQRMGVEIEKFKEQMAEIESEYMEFKNITKNLEARMKPLFEQMNDSDLKLKQININAKHHQDKLKQSNEKLKLAKAEMDVKKKFFKAKLDEALKLGERMLTTRSINEIVKELDEINEQIEEIKASLGDKLTISQTYMRFQAKYDKTKDEVDKVKHCLHQMVETVEYRARHYHRLAEYIGIRVKEMFTAVLKLRQFKGSIEIDHEKQVLELVVIPQHGSSEATGRTHILSGGERSYSTVAFLHALWQVMEYPFYFMDEFDVFLDKINRRTVMDIVLEHAKEHQDLQFVFVTPQDVSHIMGDKNITIHRLADPDRAAKI